MDDQPHAMLSRANRGDGLPQSSSAAFPWVLNAASFRRISPLLV